MKTPANEFVHSRLLNATPEAVYEAWTNPQLLARWWGPNGFTNTFHVFEPKPGGTWKFTMHGPNGKDFENHCSFRELVKPERVVIEHIEPVHVFTLYGIFEARGNQTLLTFRQVFATVEEADRVRPYVPQANEQNIDRMETVLQENR